MKKSLLILITFFSISFLLADENEVLLLPYNATSLTQEQSESNPTFLAYPTTLQSQIPEMECPHTFTINAEGNRVEFSKGNLQYRPSTDTWRFAEHQWDAVCDDSGGTVYENGVMCDNTKISGSYTGWIDLFAWGTSGWPRGWAEYYEPTSTDDNMSNSLKYYIQNRPSTNLDGTNADWGVYNQIGEDAPGNWRTLSSEQWDYIIRLRPNADNLWCMAVIGGISEGCILLPDNWRDLDGLVVTPGNNASANNFTMEDWTELEKHGAVFLPKSGCRMVRAYGAGIGAYWSSTANTTMTTYVGSQIYYPYAYHLSFGTNPAVSSERRCYGLSVRLVKDVY